MRFLRVPAVLLICAAVLAAPQAGAVFALLGFQNSLIEFLLDQISVEGELEITAQSVTAPEDGITSIEGLSVSDRDGVWLEIETLDFRWNDNRLLLGEVEITELTATGVDVLRAPVTSDPDAPEPERTLNPEIIPKIAWPRSPLTVRVDRMDLGDVRIAEAVLGHAIAFNAAGYLRDEGDIQAAGIDLIRNDAIGGRISFHYERNFADRTFAIAIDAAEDAGGMLADLAGLPTAAPSRFVLDASGPPEDYAVDFDMDLAEIVRADGRADLSYAGRVSLEALFTASPGPRMAPEFASIVGEQGELRVSIAENADSTITIRQGALQSPHATASASGSFNRTTRALDIALLLEVDSEIARPFDSVALDGISFAGSITGAPGAIVAEGDLDVTGLTTPLVDARVAELVTRYEQTPADARTIHGIEISGLTRGLRIDRIGADIIGEAETQLIVALDGTRVDLETLWLDSGVLAVSASGGADLDTLEADIGIGISTPNLLPVGQAYGVEASGEVQILAEVQQILDATLADVQIRLVELAHALVDARSLELDGVVSSDDGILDFDLQGHGEAMRIDLIGPEILTKGDIELDGRLLPGAIALDAMSLVSPLLNADAFGRIDTDDGQGKINYSLATPDLGPVAAIYDLDVGGRLSARGDMAFLLSRNQATPELIGQALIQDMAWQGRPLGDVTLDHDVIVSDPITGSAAMRVTAGPYAPASLAADITVGTAGAALRNLVAEAFGVSLQGDLSADPASGTAEGRVDVRTRQIRTALARFGVTGVDGPARGSVTLSSEGGRQDAALSLTLERFRADALSIARADAEGTLRDILGSPAIRLDIKSRGVTADALDLDRADLRLAGPLSALDFGVDTAGRFRTLPVSLGLSGRASVMAEEVLARITRLDAASGAATVGLRKPARVRASAGGFSVSGLDLALPADGSLTGDLAQIAGAPVADIRLSLPRLNALGPLTGLALDSGALDIAARIDGRPGRAAGTATVTARNLNLNGVDLQQGLDADAKLDWNGRRAVLGGTIGGAFGKPIRFSADVPVAAARPVPRLVPDAPLSGKIDWTGDIGDVWALLPLPGQIMTGRTTIDLALDGTPAQPVFRGTTRIEDGIYQYLEAGTILTGVALAISPNPSGGLEISLDGSDGAEGRVTATGLLKPFKPMLDLNARLDSAVVVRRSDIGARASGNIRVSGPPTDLSIGGAIGIEEAEIRLVTDPGAGIVTLGDVIFLGQEPPEPEPPSTTQLDIKVDAPGRVFVRGRGLDSEWKMALAVTGDADAPRISGGLERVRGTLSLLGKTFDLDRGRISFDGSPEIDPLLDLVLERRTRTITGRVVIGGFASDPELSFRSTPALPEDEVLPRIIFGKERGEIRASQGLQLALGVATLLDGTGGVVDQVRGTLGLDTLRIDENDEGEAAVAVGRQLSDEVWVGARQDIGDGGTSVVVEVEVIDDVLLDAELDRDGEASIGIEWKKDF
ncbi:MAG: translocation/assembly module TamB domain-containing protein [Pseudomonadota bacterium]